MDRCEAQTAKRTRCKRGAVNGKYCTQHTPKDTTLVEPWTDLALPTPHADTRKPVLSKLRTKLRLPAERRSGAKGHLYVYRIEGDTPGYWKIGMTERDVDVRLAEWAASHKGHEVVLVKQYDLPRAHKWVERVVHLYLNYCRVYRYGDGNGGFYSVWAATREPVVEPATKVAGSRRIPAIRKQVEWFRADSFMRQIDPIISAIVAVL